VHARFVSARDVHPQRVDEERARRVGRNEAVFRELNSQLAGLAGQSRLLSCVCECGELSCVETIAMSLDAYRRLRADATTFAIVPGHEKEDVEDVVAAYDGYEVVRKKPGLPAQVARETR